MKPRRAVTHAMKPVRKLRRSKSRSCSISNSQGDAEKIVQALSDLRRYTPNAGLPYDCVELAVSEHVYIEQLYPGSKATPKGTSSRLRVSPSLATTIVR
jgi:hypothetical protein